MRGAPVGYSEVELAWLEEHRTMSIQAYTVAFCHEFSRQVSAQNLHALRKRRGWRTGRNGQFPKGATPANKGTTCAPGTGGRHPNAIATQFAKGGRTGRALAVWKPIGTERLSREGYLERKIHEGLPLQSRWRAVHLIEWEALYGSIPSGMVLKCRGDRKITSPDNWQLVPRALLPRLNGGRRRQFVAYDSASEDIKPAVMTVAMLEYEARQKRRSTRA